jgi:transglutaminase-like putative cysteine protease
MKKFVLTTIITLIAFTSLSAKVHAYIAERNTDRVYEVNSDFVKITETRSINLNDSTWIIPSSSEEVFTIFNPSENDPNKQEKVDKTLASITITDNFGNYLLYHTETTPQGNVLISAFTAETTTMNSPYTIQISYNSYGLLLKSGALRDVYIPGFSDSYKFETDTTKENISTKIIVPKSFGNINFIQPTVGYIADGDNWIINIEASKLVSQTGWIQVGTTQYYSFEINQPYQKTSDVPVIINTYRIVIPRDIQSGPITQNVFYHEITPTPYAIETDKDGNLIAVFKIQANISGEIKINGFGVVTKDPTIDYRGASKISDIPQNLIDENSSTARYWESDSAEINQALKEIAPDLLNMPVYEITSNIYRYVIDKIDYSEVKKFGVNERQGALATLKGGAAVCMEYSDLFIALMRAAKVPTRAAFGYGYSALDYSSTTDNTINHQWAEVYMPSIKSWVSVDTTWGENGPELIGGDLNHFYSHVASIDPETPSTLQVAFYGSIDVLPERKMKVFPEESMESKENTMTAKELLEKYPAKEESFLETIKLTLEAGITKSNARIDLFLLEVLDIESSQVKSLIKIFVLILPFALYFGYKYFISQREKARRRKLLQIPHPPPIKSVTPVT